MTAPINYSASAMTQEVGTLKRMRMILRFYLVSYLLSFSAGLYGQSNDFYRPPGGSVQIIIGANFDVCSKLNAADVQTRREAQRWFIGYFSAAFIYGDFADNAIVAKRMNDLDSVITFQNIQKFCKENPNERFIVAVQRVLNQLILKNNVIFIKILT